MLGAAGAEHVQSSYRGLRREIVARWHFIFLARIWLMRDFFMEEEREHSTATGVFGVSLFYWSRPGGLFFPVSFLLMLWTMNF